MTPTYQLDAIFNEASIPEVTFVKPKEHRDLVASLETKGKHITICGPSGCGKTTLVRKALQDAGVGTGKFEWASGREFSNENSWENFISKRLNCSIDHEDLYSWMKACGILVIDDFHHLKSEVRNQIGKNLKLWHEKEIRILIIGIAASAHDLLTIDPELGIRNDPYEMKVQDDSFCSEVIERGEKALNLKFSDKSISEIIKVCKCIPSALQAICRIACVHSDVKQTCTKNITINISLSEIREAVLRIYKGKYFTKTIGLAKGKQQARSVHNTYFEIIRNICLIDRSEIPAEELFKRIVGSQADPKERSRKSTSFYNCLNYLPAVIADHGLEDALFYDSQSRTLSIEDPSFRFYLSLIDIEEIKKHIFVRSGGFEWDVAVSFSGTIRQIVEEFVLELKKNGINVFYDFDEQFKLWGTNLRRKLADVYANDAQYMVVFLNEDYPEKDWPSFELSIGKDAREKRTSEYLLPIVVDDVKVVGISDDIFYLDLRKITPIQAAHEFINKLESSQQTAFA